MTPLQPLTVYIPQNHSLTVDIDDGLILMLNYYRRNTQGPGLDFDTLYDTMVSSSTTGSAATTTTAATADVAVTSNHHNRLGSSLTNNNQANNHPNHNIISRYQSLLHTSKSFQMSEELNRKILNLMRFEVVNQPSQPS